jgi:hypothetical protein
LDKPWLLGPQPPVPNKILVEITKSSLFKALFLIALPNTISASPPPYNSALSKKLIPASNAVLIISSASPKL